MVLYELGNEEEIVLGFILQFITLYLGRGGHSFPFLTLR